MTWYLDNVNLSTLAWNIKNRSAGWSVPSKVGENVRVPGRHGAYWSPSKPFDQGQLSLSMWAVGCNEDGSFPITGDAQRKVRDNLDRLTALFGNSRRLLTLRQESADTSQTNEVENPTLVADSKQFETLARNLVQDSDRKWAESTVISRNLSSNPFMRGRSRSEIVATEDLYPDPGLWRWSKSPKTSLLRSYYYPIHQNASTSNWMFEPINGFTHSTGGSQGIFKAAKNVSLPANSWLGTFRREVFVPNNGRTVFLAQLKLATNAPMSTVRVNVVPQTSRDNVNWETGSALSTVTLNKDTYTWLTCQANALPTSAGGTYFVRYQLRLVDATSWNAGNAIISESIAIQDAPRNDNPWVNSVDPSLMIVGGVTKYVTSRGNPAAMGWSEFARPSAQDWEVVQTSSQATTAPYAYAWGNYVSSRNEGNVAFSVFGGTYQTFRRVLPAAAHTMTDQKIWGKFWRGATKNSNAVVRVRVTQRTGSKGAYTYTTVASTTISPTNKTTAFTSGSFTTSPGKTYCLEFDIPAGSNGLAPSFTLREIHVSNGLVNTLMPTGFTSWAADDIPRSAYSGIVTPKRVCNLAKQRGTLYQTSIEGRTYLPHGVTEGIPRSQSKSSHDPFVDWSKEPQGVMARNGKIEFPKETLPASAQQITVRLRGGIATLAHLSSFPFKPTTASAQATLTLYKSSGAVSRTLTFTLGGMTGSWKSWSYTVARTADEVAASVKVEYSSTTHPMSNIILAQYHLMTDLPHNFNHFTGGPTETTAAWPRTQRWDGVPYLSKSTMSVALPRGWDIPNFKGFDDDGYTIRFSGPDIRVPIARADGGEKLVGFRRGTYTSDITVSVKPEGATTFTSLGVLTSSQAHVMKAMTIPEGTNYIDFRFGGGSPYVTMRDIHVLDELSNLMPITQGGWLGFSDKYKPQLYLPSHPASRYPTMETHYYGDMISRLRTPIPEGWTSPLVSGGYLPVAKVGTSHWASTLPLSAAKTFINGALKLKVESDVASKVKVRLQATDDANLAKGAWWTLEERSVVAGSQEIVFRDVRITDDRRWARLSVTMDNTTSSVTRSGAAVIVEGASLVPYNGELGSAFPGFFVGSRGPDGIAPAVGHTRQAHVEVTEAIDMTSQAYGTIAEFNVNMTVPGAFWEDVFDTRAELVGTGSKGSFYVSDFGGATAPMQDLTIIVEAASGGTFTQFSLTDQGSGDRVSYKGPAQSKVVINTTLAEVRNGDGDSVMKHISGMGTSNIMSLSPYVRSMVDGKATHLDGVPILNWSGSTALKITIVGRRKYLIG